MRNETTYEAGAVTRWDRTRDRGTAEFPPFEHEACGPLSIRPAVPTHRYLTTGGRQCAVLGSVRNQLVKHHRQRLCGRRSEHDIRVVDPYVCSRRIGRELVADEVNDANSLPTAMT